MELVDAVKTLKFLVESDDEKEALRVLIKATQGSGNGVEKSTYKQVMFIQQLAFNGGVNALEELDSLGIEQKTNLRDLTKKEASKLINEFKRRGYMEKQ